MESASCLPSRLPFLGEGTGPLRSQAGAPSWNLTGGPPHLPVASQGTPGSGGGRVRGGAVSCLFPAPLPGLPPDGVRREPYCVQQHLPCLPGTAGDACACTWSEQAPSCPPIVGVPSPWDAQGCRGVVRGAHPSFLRGPALLPSGVWGKGSELDRP